MRTFDPARARETARRIREGKKPTPLVEMVEYDPEAVVISTWANGYRHRAWQPLGAGAGQAVSALSRAIAFARKVAA